MTDIADFYRASVVAIGFGIRVRVMVRVRELQVTANVKRAYGS